MKSAPPILLTIAGFTLLVIANVIFWGGMYLLLAALISLPGCSLL